MKKPFVIIGVILLVVGLVMMLWFWPMIGYVNKDDDLEKLAEDLEKGDLVRYVGEVTNVSTFLGISMIELDDGEFGAIVDDADEFAEGDKAMISFEWPGDNATDMPDMTVQKVPTMLGLVGLIVLIVGVVLMLLGFIMGGKEEAPAAAPAPEPMAEPEEMTTPEPMAPAPEPAPEPAPGPDLPPE